MNKSESKIKETSNGMKILTVVPLQKGIPKEKLSYFSAEDMPVGSVVDIYVGKRKLLGLVVEVKDASQAKSEIKNMDFNLRKINGVKEKSLFRTEFISSVLLTASYFLNDKNSIFDYLIPSLLKEEYDEFAKYLPKTNKSKPEELSNIKKEKLLFQSAPEERISYYRTLIRTSFASKNSLFIVVPKESDIVKFEKGLAKGIEDFVITLGSSLPKKKLRSRIEQVLNEDHPVILIGTPMFLVVPRHDISTIILEQESSGTYKTFMEPFFDQRMFVETLASQIGARLILADTILRFETIARLDTEALPELAPMSYRVGFNGDFQVIEKNKKATSDSEIISNTKGFRIISNECLSEIGQIIESGKNVFVFSLRKGLATMTTCNHCGNTISCTTCESPVVLYKSKDGAKRIFVCNKCKKEYDPDTSCEYCGSWDLTPLGIGTDTVYEELMKQFPNYTIFKLDKDSASTAKQAENIVKEFEKCEGAILVGTELALFYLNQKVPLSVVASFDSLWSIPNYKITEKVLRILLGLAEHTENRLIIETKNPNNEILTAVRSGHLASIVRSELADRENLGYPPYKKFIKISFTGNKDEALEVRQYLNKLFHEYEPHVFGGYVSKQKGLYIVNCLLKLDNSKWSTKGSGITLNSDQGLRSRLESLGRGFKILIDPEDLL